MSLHVPQCHAVVGYCGAGGVAGADVEDAALVRVPVLGGPLGRLVGERSHLDRERACVLLLGGRALTSEDTDAQESSEELIHVSAPFGKQW